MSDTDWHNLKVNRERFPSYSFFDSNGFLKNLPSFILFTFIAVLLYHNTISGTFLWDDWEYITRNPVVTQAKTPFDTWVTFSQIDYWPLTYSTLWIFWKIFGAFTTPYHLFNILLHSANAVLVLRILRRLNLRFSLGFALLFLVHPVNTQAVAWIIQMKTLLSTFFLFLALSFYEERHRLRSWVSFLLALTAKTSAVFFPLFLFSWEIVRHRLETPDSYSLRTRLLKLIPFWLLSLAFTITTHQFYEKLNIPGFNLNIAPLHERLQGALFNLLFYIKKVIFPIHLSFIYQKPESPSLLATLLIGILVTVFVVSLALFVCFKRPKAWGNTLFGILFYLCALLPALGLVYIPYMRFANTSDHWQYPAVLGYVIILASGFNLILERLSKKRVVWVILPGLPYLLYLYMSTQTYAAYFQNELSLWEYTVQESPSSAISWYNLGLAQRKEKKDDASLRSFQRSYSLDPTRIDTVFDLACAYFDQGQYEKAAEVFREASKLDPTETKAPINLAITLIQLNKCKEAESILEKVVSAPNPMPEAVSALSQCRAQHPNLGSKQILKAK